ncbi:MAG: DinB family protein [Chitinophagales bacterium]
MKQLNWTLRTFNFNFPAELFPVILARLQGAFARIKFITDDLSKEKLIYRPEGKWSIQQHIGHLIDLEELHTQRIYDFREGKAMLSAWDGKNEKTELANHNEKNISILLREFNNVRNHFVTELEKFSDPELIKTSIHPRLQKPMRVVDMAFFVAEHDDHHIAKMMELKSSLL